MLSQRSGPDQKMHPCAFFSRRLNPAERNYDVGNRQLLAVKLALEKWRHWLEGTEQPFIVWKDHKNHAYIQTAKRLNSHQARWALFFVRFNFTLTYRPGSRNMKPDTLSRMHHSPADAPDPDTILPPSGVLVAISWEIKSVIREAQRTHPNPGNPNRLFVTDPVRSEDPFSGSIAHVSPVTLATGEPCPCSKVFLVVQYGGQHTGSCQPARSALWENRHIAWPTLVSHSFGLRDRSAPVPR